MPWMCLMGGHAQHILSEILVLLGSNDLRFVAAPGEMEGVFSDLLGRRGVHVSKIF